MAPVTEKGSHSNNSVPDEKGCNINMPPDEIENVCNSNIPDDVLLIILSKLPLKSLKRLACVKKSWLHLFDNPRFMSMFCSNFISNCRYNDNSCLLLKKSMPPKLICISGERFGEKLSLPLQYVGDTYFRFLGFGYGIHGTVCIYNSNRGEEALVWNPAMQESLIIPPSPFNSNPDPHYFDCEVIPCGFGYDHIGDDYKLIQCVNFSVNRSDDEADWNNPPEFPNDILAIYSVRSSTWSKLDVNMPPPYSGEERSCMYLNGVCHWISSPTDGEIFLMSFDLGIEVVFTTPLPSNVDEYSIFLLAELNGSIALISYIVTEDPSFDISILGKIGVKESWTKLFTFGPIPGLRYIIGAGKKGEIFFFKHENQLACFDMSTQMVEEVGVDVGPDDYMLQLVIYKESFLPIRGFND